MKKFKGNKRSMEEMDDNDMDDSGPDYADMAIGATAKKKSPRKDMEEEPKGKKKKMPDSAKKALKLAIKAKLKKKAKSDESE